MLSSVVSQKGMQLMQRRLSIGGGFLLSVAIVAIVFALWSIFSLSDTRPVNTDGKHIAIRGYDPVAYFTEGAPKSGSPDIEYEWAGAVWRFATTEHRELFRGDPEKYAPQYGGYCAMGVADGFIANIDPEAWTISEGRLYLNRNKALMKKWRADPAGNTDKADANWSGDIGKLKNVWSDGP